MYNLIHHEQSLDLADLVVLICGNADLLFKRAIQIQRRQQ